MTASRPTMWALVMGGVIAAWAGFAWAADPVQELFQRPAGARGGTNRTLITSQTLSYDYTNSVATLEGDVDISDAQMRLRSDKVVVKFAGTNKLERLLATGNVRMLHEGKRAVCREAEYTAVDGRVVLRGDATVTRGTDSVSGQMITLWLNEDRVQVSGGPTRMVLQPVDWKSKATDLEAQKPESVPVPRDAKGEDSSGGGNAAGATPAPAPAEVLTPETAPAAVVPPEAGSTPAAGAAVQPQGLNETAVLVPASANTGTVSRVHAQDVKVRVE